jgi:hypothetical protein
MLRKIRNLWRFAGIEMMKNNSGKTHVRLGGPFVLPEQVSYVVRHAVYDKKRNPFLNCVSQMIL